MSELNPLVSIIIPTYNRADLIIETLESVKRQTYPNWECIIVDDGSDDETDEIVNHLLENENRIQFYERNREPKGASTCRNIGLEKSNGQYIIFLDSDDLLIEACLQKRVEFMNKNLGYNFYCFPTGLFSDFPNNSKCVWNYLNKKTDDLIRFFQQDMPWCTYGVLWDKKFLQQIGGWNETLSSWQDWDIHIRSLMVADLKYKKVRDTIENIDSFYRVNGKHDSIAKSFDSKKYVETKMNLLNDITFPKTLHSQPEVQLEFARLCYRTAKDAVPLLGYKTSKTFLKRNLLKMGFDSIFIFLWAGYLNNLCNQHENKGFRRIYNLAPRIYANRNLMLNKSTHLKAVYTQ